MTLSKNPTGSSAGITAVSSPACYRGPGRRLYRGGQDRQVVGIVTWRRVTRTEDDRLLRVSNAISALIVNLGAKLTVTPLVTIRSRFVEQALLLLAIYPLPRLVYGEVHVDSVKVECDDWSDVGFPLSYGWRSLVWRV